MLDRTASHVWWFSSSVHVGLLTRLRRLEFSTTREGIHDSTMTIITANTEKNDERILSTRASVEMFITDLLAPPSKRCACTRS